MTDFGTHKYSGRKCPFLDTDTILWSVGIFVLSTAKTKPCLNDVDIISGFASGTSESPSGSLVTEVVRNNRRSPQAVSNIAEEPCSDNVKTTSPCGAECLLEGQLQILMLFGIIWSEDNTPQTERENLLSPLTC